MLKTEKGIFYWLYCFVIDRGVVCHPIVKFALAFDLKIYTIHNKEIRFSAREIQFSSKKLKALKVLNYFFAFKLFRSNAMLS